jgi:hypothetical protein
MKQTSIDWLIAEFQKLEIQITMDSTLKLMTAIETAKEMLYQEQIDLVQHLKDYTYESHNILGFDDREASEFVDIFNQTFNQ